LHPVNLPCPVRPRGFLFYAQRLRRNYSQRWAEARFLNQWLNNKTRSIKAKDRAVQGAVFHKQN
jgi:hypothetical protein